MFSSKNSPARQQQQTSSAVCQSSFWVKCKERLDKTKSTNKWKNKANTSIKVLCVDECEFFYIYIYINMWLFCFSIFVSLSFWLSVLFYKRVCVWVWHYSLFLFLSWHLFLLFRLSGVAVFAIPPFYSFVRPPMGILFCLSGCSWRLFVLLQVSFTYSA